MRRRWFLLIVLVLSLGTQGSPAQAEGGDSPIRPVENAFFDDFNYTDGEGYGPPILAQMPFNWGDTTADGEDLPGGLIAALRVDSFADILASGPYRTFEELLAAFYANQVAFNDDPTRNQIQMSGSIRETTDEDGRVLAVVNIKYSGLPLTIYTLESWSRAFDSLDLGLLEPVLVDGTFSLVLHATFVLPYAGAPLLFWELEQLSQRLSGAHGEGTLVAPDGSLAGRARVRLAGPEDNILITPVG